VVDAARLGVLVLLPEPVADHVQAWRRSLDDPARALIPPHVTLVPPQTVGEADLDTAIALVDRAAAAAAASLIELRGAATFLPDSPVAYLVVAEGTAALGTLEAALREPPLQERGFPFHPHVTVAQDRPPAELEAAARDLADFHAVFPLRELTLMEAREAGPGCRIVHQVELGSSPVVRVVPLAGAASAAVFLFDGSRVLLGQRTRRAGHRYPGAWDAVGGKPEDGESLLEGLVREVREEAGVEPLGASPLGCFDDGERADAFYLATEWSGEVHNSDWQEHDRLEWVRISEAVELPLAATTRRALARLLDVLGHGR
jgi:8-oxo-dGTP pyrophosphatase MutT (NUDIX family)/2'-5' RNA ligase